MLLLLPISLFVISAEQVLKGYIPDLIIGANLM